MKTSADAGPQTFAEIRPDLRGLFGVRGQPAVVAALQKALAAGRPHHAYLFDGPEGVGKATTARALMAALNCQGRPGGVAGAAGEADPGAALPPGAACGECESCSKLRSGSHPDFITMDMTLAGLADEVERLLRRLQYPPVEGRAQLILIDPADVLTAPTAQTAANRLLKTLEEPRAQTHFVLVTTAATALLSTIRSRCQRLRFTPLPDEVVHSELTHTFGIGEELAGGVVKLAQGSLGRALRYVQDQEGLTKRQQLATELYLAAQSGRAGRIVAAAADAGSDRDEAQELLELLWLRLHGELRVAAQRPEVRDSGAVRLLAALRSVRDAQGAIRRYTSAPLALERMARQLHAALWTSGSPGVTPGRAGEGASRASR
jgi:DNA polymerase-3 subunit delta'